MGKRSRHRNRHQNGWKNHKTQHDNKNTNARALFRGHQMSSKHRPPQKDFDDRRDKYKDFEEEAQRSSSREAEDSFQSSLGSLSDGNGTFSSRKRSLAPVEFVFPKKNGFKEPYRFENFNKRKYFAEKINGRNGSNGEGRSQSESKSIENILYPSRKRSQKNEDEEESGKKKNCQPKNGSESVHEVSAVQEHSPATSGDDTSSRSVEGQLSGRSVEDAVRDEVGCRPRANSTDGELNLPQRGLCDERTVLGAYRWRPDLCDIRPGRPKGFNNLGNTCYLNSTLQCLAHTPAFCQTLLTLPSRQNGTEGPSQGKQFTLMLKKLFARAHRTAPPSIPPSRLVNAVPALGNIGMNKGGYIFRPGRQEDCHEFLG